MPILVFGLAGLLAIADAAVVGLLVGFVVRSDWQLNVNGNQFLYLAAVVAAIAYFKRRMERYIDDTYRGGAHHEDEHIKQLLREVLDERDTVG